MSAVGSMLRAAASWRAHAIWLLLFVGMGFDASAQRAEWSTVTGRIVDAGSMLPLEGAVVVLRRDARAAQGEARAGAAYWSAVTDETGDYRFGRLAPAVYRMRVERIGYRPDSLELDLRGNAPARVSLALESSPVLLPPVQVLANASQPYLREEAPGEAPGTARRLAMQLRQDQHLASDARELTHREVLEANTLAESDVFRALQRIPGVSTRDDYTATLWTRGATWDQTRVYLDGLPLYNPTHAGWLFSAVNPDALGAVTFHPGVRSARWGEGAAGILDLRTRSGQRESGVRGRGELSLASARLALDGGIPVAGLSWMVAGRRTYVDLITGMRGALNDRAEDVIPYDFSDLTGRVDLDAGRGWSATATGILERDRLRGDIAGLLRGNRGRWGNRSGQMSITIPLGGLAARASYGETDFSAIISDSVAPGSARRGGVTLPYLENSIVHRLRSLSLEPRRRPGWGGWGFGYQHVDEEVFYNGPHALLSAIAALLPGERIEVGQVKQPFDLAYHAGWGELRLDLSSALSLDAGVRVERGSAVRNGGTNRVAPRLAARWQAPEGTLLSAGYSRTFQYTQDVAPVAGPVGPQLHLSHLWVQAGQDRRYSALKADIVTLGAERWIAEEWVGAVNVYGRRISGVAIPNPVPERVVPDRDVASTAENVARGLELSLRRLAGQWTGSAGYSLANSEMHARDVPTLSGQDTTLAAFPSSADIRHTLDATAAVRVAERWQLGGAFTFGSGAPYTELLLPDSTQLGRGAVLGAPNVHRTPFYASLDLMADYTVARDGWQLTAFAQLRNALNRDNAVTYAGSRSCVGGGVTGRDAPRCVRHEFQGGIPRLPMVGLRVSF